MSPIAPRPLRAAVVSFLLVASLAGLGCSFPLLGGRTPPRLFDVVPPRQFDQPLPKVSWQLAVEEPLAGRAIDTDRIALRPGPHELRYYADARWADRAPRLVQSLLVEAFEESGAIVRVARQSVGFASDYVLRGEIREMEALLGERPGAGPRVRVRVTLRLLRSPRGEIVDTRTFSAERRAGGSTIDRVVEAFGDALRDVCREAVGWTLVTGERDRVRKVPSAPGADRPRG